jgi:hypothetical protein
MAFPAKASIEAYLTDTFSLSFHYKDSGGTGVNLSSAVIEMDVRDSDKDPTSQVVWSTATNEIAVTQGGNLNVGQFTVTVPASGIERLGTRGTVTSYFYEVRTTQSAVVDTLVHGQFSVYGEARP